MKYIYVLLLWIFTISICDAQWPHYRPTNSPSKFEDISDATKIEFLIRTLPYISHNSNNKSCREYVTKNLYDSLISKKKSNGTRNPQLYLNTFSIDNINIKISDNIAIADFLISNRNSFQNEKEIMTLKKESNNWVIASSNFLINYLVSQEDPINGNGSDLIKTNEKIATTLSITGGSLISSSDINSSLSNNAIIPRTCWYTDYMTINKSVTYSELSLNLFSGPSDGKVVRLDGTEANTFSVISDRDWNRIIYAKYKGVNSWVKSYGNNVGEEDLSWASSIGLDKFGNIFVLTDFPKKIYQLKYDDNIETVSYVKQVPLPGVKEPLDFCLGWDWINPNNQASYNLWVADGQGNAIFNFDWNGVLQHKFTKVISSDGSTISFINPSKVIYFCAAQYQIAIIDNFGKRIIWINNPSYGPDYISGNCKTAQFSDESNVSMNSIGLTYNNSADGLWVCDNTNGFIHLFSLIDFGYIGSIKTNSSGQTQWCNPKFLTSTYLTNSNGQYLDFLTMDKWDDTHGINTYLSGADLIAPSVRYAGTASFISASFLGMSKGTASLYNYNTQALIKNYSENWFFTQRINDLFWISTNDVNRLGKYFIRFGLTPFNNPQYPSQYQQPILYKDVLFALPPLGGISGPSSGPVGTLLTWNVNMTEGSNDFSYKWYKENYDESTWTLLSSTNSIQSLNMGNKAFTIKCEITDNFTGQITSASLFITNITTHGALTSDEVWSGNITVTGTVTIPIGLTLTMNPGTIVYFNNNASLNVQGKLNALGSSSHPIYMVCSSSGYWGTINLNGSGANGSTIQYANIQFGTEIDISNSNNIAIQNCNITSSSMHGINFISGTGCTAINNTIRNTNTAHGIYVQNGANVSCTGNIIMKTNSNHTGVGIYFGGGGTGKAILNDISGFSWGIGTTWGSSPNSDRGLNSALKNNRVSNCSIGLEVYNESYPVFGSQSINDQFGGNSVYGNNTNVYVYNSSSNYHSTVNGQNNWWGAAPPNNSLFYQGLNGILYYNFYLSTDPWAGIPPPSIKQLAGGKPDADFKNQAACLLNTSAGGIGNSAVSTSDEMDSLFIGITLLNSNKFSEAKDFYISYINLHPDNQAAYTYLYNCADSSTITEIINFFSSLPSKASKEQKLLLAYLYHKQGNIDLAKKTNDKIVKENSNTFLSVRAILNNFYIALYDDNDQEAASALLNKVKGQANLSTQMEISTAEDALTVYGSFLSANSILPMHKQASNKQMDKPTSYSLSQNYPNPFNPSTSITYQIPNPGYVTLKVYDVLGKEVVALVNEYKNVGQYNVNFDASKLASGIYIYQLKSNDFISSKKMMLLK
jgi:tetratricopeptide (TPR) repeat protein